jgi:hypothetical protein
MKSYPRREFVMQALVACGCAFLGPASTLGAAGERAAGQANGPAAGAAKMASAYFGGRADGASKVGSAFLRQMGVDAGPASILNATRATTRLIDRASSQDSAIAALVSAVRKDFEDGRSVQVDGWILSRTEADLCALTLLPAVN